MKFLLQYKNKIFVSLQKEKSCTSGRLEINVCVTIQRHKSRVNEKKNKK